MATKQRAYVRVGVKGRRTPCAQVTIRRIMRALLIVVPVVSAIACASELSREQAGELIEATFDATRRISVTPTSDGCVIDNSARCGAGSRFSPTELPTE